MVLGAGQLQFEVFQYRLLNEYNAEVILTPLEARLPDDLTKKQLDPNMSSSRNSLCRDNRFAPTVFLFESQFAF